MIPDDRPIRVVGDVHGDVRAFAYAVETDRFIVQLGDMIDSGPDSAGALRLMFRLLDENRAVWLLGNHERKLGRALAGEPVTIGPELRATLGQLDEDVKARALREIGQAPAWTRRQKAFFVHGGFHTQMLDTQPPPALGRVSNLMARALFGQTTGRVQPDGYPERVLDWVNRIPAGMTVYCGHDRRSTDGRPWVTRGSAGGTAVFLDTGAGKGGHLSWIDLPPG